MNRIQLPVAIRTTAAALAVFMTIATLNCLIAVAEPQQSALMAQIAARHAAGTGSGRHINIVALAPMTEIDP